MKWLDLIARIINGAMNAINRSNKKKMSDNTANTIANSDDGVQQSGQSFSDLASKSRSDKAE